MDLDESEQSILDDEYRDILNKGEELEENHRSMPRQLDKLYGILTDLYIDKFKFQGQNVKSHVPELLRILDKCDLDEIIAFFENTRTVGIIA